MRQICPLFDSALIRVAFICGFALALQNPINSQLKPVTIEEAADSRVLSLGNDPCYWSPSIAEGFGNSVIKPIVVAKFPFELHRSFPGPRFVSDLLNLEGPGYRDCYVKCLLFFDDGDGRRVKILDYRIPERSLARQRLMGDLYLEVYILSGYVANVRQTYSESFGGDVCIKAQNCSLGANELLLHQGSLPCSCYRSVVHLRQLTTSNASVINHCDEGSDLNDKFTPFPPLVLWITRQHECSLPEYIFSILTAFG